MRQKESFWNWYKMMGIIKALKYCQNLFQVVVCPCPGAFFKWWPWVDHDHFYDRVRFVSWCLCMGDSLYSIECSCISKFVLIQHILSTQVSDTGPVLLWLWRTWENYPLIITKYPPYLFYWCCYISFTSYCNNMKILDQEAWANCADPDQTG